MAGIMCAKAQIGYQISLLNTATGEPRANETVTVTISLSYNAGEVFYSETKSATTNDFGVLSLTIGNANTFKDVDLTKMPFYIEATVNGVMIGKSQILSVPVAEVAKRIVPTLTEEELCSKTWSVDINPFIVNMTFSKDSTCKYINDFGGSNEGIYKIQGNAVFFLSNSGRSIVLYYYNGKLYACS